MTEDLTSNRVLHNITRWPVTSFSQVWSSLIWCHCLFRKWGRVLSMDNLTRVEAACSRAHTGTITSGGGLPSMSCLRRQGIRLGWTNAVYLGQPLYISVDMAPHIVKTEQLGMSATGRIVAVMPMSGCGSLPVAAEDSRV